MSGPLFDEATKALRVMANMSLALKAAEDALTKIRARDFNCAPHQHAMAASGRAEQALAEMHRLLGAS